MKKIALAALAASLTATPAFAQDEDSFTGAYVGVSLGWNSAKSDTVGVLGGAWSSESTALQTHVTDRLANSENLQSINFGGQLGYNQQMGSVVVGIEGEITALSGKRVVTRGPIATPPFPSLSYTTTHRFDPKVLYAVKGKLGVVTGNTMFFAEGGWAWTDADYGFDLSSNGNYSKSGRLSKTTDGWIVGGGIEHKFTKNLSARLTYDYTDQGSVTYATGYNAGSAFTSPAYNETLTQDLRIHLVRVGFNFSF